MVWVGVVEVIDIPATIAWELRGHGAPPGHELPQAVRGHRAAWVTATHSDDGQRFARAVLELPQLRTGLVEVDGAPLQVLDELFLLRVVAFTAHGHISPA